MEYSHDQWGYGGLLGLVITVVATLGVIVAVAADSETGAIVLLTAGWIPLIGLIVLAFSRLRVVVDSTDVRIAFLFGWPRKAIPLADVVSAEPVRNKWWYGWGIRRTPQGWMWNVHGLDAVELSLANGKTFRIGTDEPQDLVGAITIRGGRSLS